tara:strand:+ start:570 stop:770 length:201 start_codon:yes stop_codon:yes gene_type:complete
MINNQKLIVTWASLRASHLYNLHKYEDSYAVSQEFFEWTASCIDYSDSLKASILKVPNFNKENRTN